jgi:hypothetical protein
MHVDLTHDGGQVCLSLEVEPCFRNGGRVGQSLPHFVICVKSSTPHTVFQRGRIIDLNDEKKVSMFQSIAGTAYNYKRPTYFIQIRVLGMYRHLLVIANPVHVFLDIVVSNTVYVLVADSYCKLL